MYGKKYHEEVHEGRIKADEIYLCEALRSKLKYFENIQNNEIVLDYGGGLGQNVFLLKNRYVYDVSDYALSFCEKKVFL
jgi:hypothetical protein